MLREDSSCYSVFDAALKKGPKLYTGLVGCLSSSVDDFYVKDKAAWLLTAIMGSLPAYFSGKEVYEVLGLLKPDHTCSEQGSLAAIANILKALASLIMAATTDKQTLAVACHDIGEFVALHPLGKRKVAQLGIKERVMELMGLEGEESRELRREALLCCQKIMLNNWQAMDGAKGK